MELQEAKDLLSAVIQECLTDEFPENRRAFILLKQIEVAGYETIIILQDKSRIIPANPAVIKALARHRKKQKKRGSLPSGGKHE